MLVQILHADGLAHDAVGNEFHAHFLQVLNLHIHDSIRQAELWNTIFQYTANLVQCLEDGDVETLLRHIACKTQTGRSGTYHCYLDAISCFLLWYGDVATLAFIVGGETLQVTDGYGWLVHLQLDTLALTLFLLWTNTTTDGREGRGILQYLGRCEELATLNILDEGRNVDVDRATLHTRWLRTVEASFCLGERHLLGQTDIHLLGTSSGTINRV